MKSSERQITIPSESGLGFLSLFALGFGTIIGVGWITVLGHWLQQAGAGGAVVAFLVGALCILPIAFCYAEMAAALPDGGGEIGYSHAALGRRAALLTGWFLGFSFVTVAAFEAVSVGWITSALWPGLKGAALYSIAGSEVYSGELVVGLGLMLILGILNVLGARAAASVQNLLTFALIAICFAFIVAGVLNGSASHLTPLFVSGEGGVLQAGLLPLLATTPFWFAGFNVVPQAIAERSGAFRIGGMGLVMASVIVGAGVFYALIIVVAALTMDRSALLAADLPAVAAFEVAFGGAVWAKAALSAGLLGLLTTWNAVIFAGVRAINALWMFYRGAEGVGDARPKSKPVGVVLLVIGVGAAMTLLGRGAISPLIETAGIIISALYFVTCISQVILRRNDARRHRPFRAPGGAVCGVLGAAIAAALFSLGAAQQLFSSNGSIPLEWILLFAWAVLGVLIVWASSPKGK